MELGKSIVRTQGKDAVVVAYGSSVNEALAAAALLEEDGVRSQSSMPAGASL